MDCEYMLVCCWFSSLSMFVIFSVMLDILLFIFTARSWCAGVWWSKWGFSWRRFSCWSWPFAPWSHLLQQNWCHHCQCLYISFKFSGRMTCWKWWTQKHRSTMTMLNLRHGHQYLVLWNASKGRCSCVARGAMLGWTCLGRMGGCSWCGRNMYKQTIINVLLIRWCMNEQSSSLPIQAATVICFAIFPYVFPFWSIASLVIHAFQMTLQMTIATV